MKSEKQRKHLQKVMEARKKRGYRHSEETKAKIGKSNAIALKGIKPWNTGKHLSEEHKTKLSRAYRKLEGKDYYQWKGGSWVWWQKEIRKRDNYTCVKCKLYDPDLVQVAHIERIKGIKNRNTSGHPLNSYENLVTLCPNDHVRFDKGLIKKEELWSK